MLKNDSNNWQNNYIIELILKDNTHKPHFILSELLNGLNPSQKQAVEHIEGPLMVIAGAGSGKTRVLTYRIANLINRGVDPFNILALTFTNKAAKEMRERINQLIGNESQNLWMGTFHSVFSKILRFESDKLNYPQNFTIYDSADSKNLLKSIVKYATHCYPPMYYFYTTLSANATSIYQ